MTFPFTRSLVCRQCLPAMVVIWHRDVQVTLLYTVFVVVYFSIFSFCIQELILFFSCFLCVYQIPLVYFKNITFR